MSATKLVLCRDTDNEESRVVYGTNFEAMVRRPKVPKTEPPDSVQYHQHGSNGVVIIRER